MRVRGDEAITDTAVAGYVAKYATKSTDATGHVSKRITDRPIRIYADHSHPGRIINAAWQLGDAPTTTRACAGGRTCSASAGTSSPRASATPPHSKCCATHAPPIGAAPLVDVPTCNSPTSTTTKPPSSSTHFDFVGIGWHTTGDALLANTRAAMARERRRAAKDALQAQAS